MLAYADSYSSNVGGIFAGMLIPLLPIMIGVGIDPHRPAARRRSRPASASSSALLVVLAVARDRHRRFWAYNIGFGPAIVPALVPSVLAAFAAFGFSWLQGADKEGRKVMDQIDGFKQYLSVAEEDRLEFLNPPKKTPELFETFLPYAIALDVENSWAKRFTGVLAAAGVGAAVASWYAAAISTSTGSDMSARSPIAWATACRSTIASAATPPGSSSSRAWRRQQQLQLQRRLVGRRLFRRRRWRRRRLGLVMRIERRDCPRVAFRTRNSRP